MDSTPTPTPDAPVTPPYDSAGPCVAENVEANAVARPSDIIWVVDNSGSMDEEESRVQSNLNTFASDIIASGIDVHVIMITATSHITVPPPLGGGASYLAVDQSIDSHDALQQVLNTYPAWSSFLRPNAVRHFVVVTDDESDMSQASFEASVAGLGAPGFPDGFYFHAIVAEAPPWDFMSPCFLLAAAIGQTYIDLQASHDGVFYSLCQGDWGPVFDALSTAVTESAALPCTFGIPPAPDGQVIDFGAVNVIYTPTGGVPETIPQVTSCGAAGGWMYDDPVNPTSVVVCPASCNVLTSDPTGKVEVAFGCQTIVD